MASVLHDAGYRFKLSHKPDADPLHVQYSELCRERQALFRTGSRSLDDLNRLVGTLEALILEEENEGEGDDSMSSSAC